MCAVTTQRMQSTAVTNTSQLMLYEDLLSKSGHAIACYLVTLESGFTHCKKIDEWYSAAHVCDSDYVFPGKQ